MQYGVWVRGFFRGMGVGYGEGRCGQGRISAASAVSIQETTHTPTSQQAWEVSNFLDTYGYLKFPPFFHRILGYQLFY